MSTNTLPLPTTEIEAAMAIRFDERLIASYKSENQTDNPSYAQTVEHLETVQALFPQA